MLPRSGLLLAELEVKLLDPIASQNHDPGFLRVGGVDDHFVGHGELSRHASKIRREGRLGRPTAPRVASMLEMGKFGDWETSAAASAGRRRQTAAPATTRAAWIAAGGWWFRHRDIVILKTRRGTARRHSSGAAWRRCHDPGRAASRFRQVDSLLSARNLPAQTLAGGSQWRAIRRADNPPRRYPRRPRAVV